MGRGEGHQSRVRFVRVAPWVVAVVMPASAVAIPSGIAKITFVRILGGGVRRISTAPVVGERSRMDMTDSGNEKQAWKDLPNVFG